MGGVGVGAGGKLKAGNTIYRRQTAVLHVLSVGHRNCHNQPGRMRQSLAAV